MGALRRLSRQVIGAEVHPTILVPGVRQAANAGGLYRFVEQQGPPGPLTGELALATVLGLVHRTCRLLVRVCRLLLVRSSLSRAPCLEGDRLAQELDQASDRG